jgi:hypothetical protein
MTTIYGKHIAQLSARIFSRKIIENNIQNIQTKRIIERLSIKPLNQYDEYSMHYYPRQQDHDHLFKILRLHGLYRYLVNSLLFEFNFFFLKLC